MFFVRSGECKVILTMQMPSPHTHRNKECMRHLQLNATASNHQSVSGTMNDTEHPREPNGKALPQITSTHSTHRSHQQQLPLPTAAT